MRHDSPALSGSLRRALLQPIMSLLRKRRTQPNQATGAGLREWTSRWPRRLGSVAAEVNNHEAQEADEAGQRLCRDSEYIRPPPLAQRRFLA